MGQTAYMSPEQLKDRWTDRSITLDFLTLAF